MEAHKASHSAGIIAAHRAFESSKAPEDRICHDSFAGRFLPSGFTVIGNYDIPQETALKAFKDLVPGFHEFFLARTRYIDDCLQVCINDGLEQLVILGAGYDSRAYRFPELKNIRVFEVDHPATQRVKIEKLHEIFLALPDHVTYVSADFQSTSLQSCLLENGYVSNLLTMFIWEGVTMYIRPETVDDTLLFISNNAARGSTLIFDFTFADVVSGHNDRKEAKEWLKIGENSDEPLLFGIKNGELEKFLSKKGFCNIKNIESDYFRDNYFSGVNKDLSSTPILAIAHAEVYTP